MAEEKTIEQIIDELIAQQIEDLPEELRPWVENAAKYLKDKAVPEVKLWLNLLIDYDWQEAYRQMIAAMSYEDRAIEQGRIGESLKILNAANAEDIKKQRELIKSLISLAVTVLTKKV